LARRHLRPSRGSAAAGLHDGGAEPDLPVEETCDRLSVPSRDSGGRHRALAHRARVRDRRDRRRFGDADPERHGSFCACPRGAGASNVQRLAPECGISAPGGRIRRRFLSFAEFVMKLSARNALPGVVRAIEQGAVNAEATLELAPGLTVVSIITLDAVQSLNLKVGSKAYAVIKASSVMVAVD